MRISLNLDNINYNTQPDRSSYRVKAEGFVNDLFSCEEEFNGWVTWPLDGARQILPAIENEASRIRELCDVLVVIGIGDMRGKRLDLFEIVTTYSPVLTEKELLASGLVLTSAVAGSVYLYRRKRIRASQAAAISAMTAFLLLVAGVTLLSRPPWERSYELVPFWSYGAIARGMPGMLREVVLNCIMLLPVGVLLPFIFGRPLRWHRGLLFVFFASANS